MSKAYDIRFAIVHHCKQHGSGMQLAIDLNLDIQQTLGWCEVDDADASIEQEMIEFIWNTYDKKIKGAEK